MRVQVVPAVVASGACDTHTSGDHPDVPRRPEEQFRVRRRRGEGRGRRRRGWARQRLFRRPGSHTGWTKNVRHRLMTVILSNLNRFKKYLLKYS